MGLVYQTTGMIGSFVIASSMVPQMRKVYKSKSATDISLRFQILYCIGMGLILTYGLGEDLWPVYIPASVEVAAGLLMLSMKLYYDHRATQQDASGLDSKNSEAEICVSPLKRRSETNFVAA